MTEVTESDVKKFKELIETVRLLNNGEDYALHVSLAAIVNEYIINQTTNQLKHLCEVKGVSVVEWIEFDVNNEITIPPEDRDVLLYWKNSNHYENGSVEVFDGKLVHYLFDGEQLNDVPTHWCELPQLNGNI